MQAALRQPHSRPSFHRPIDLVHLAAQTMGDRALESEILCMFGKQMSQARVSIAKANADERKRLAHTIKGTARSVGAFPIADVAERIEKATLNSGLINDLGDEIAHVLDFVAALTR